MAERINWDVLENLNKLTFVGYVQDTAVIRKDPAKGIERDVVIPFTKPVWAAASTSDAAEAFTELGADAFNGLLNYATDLRCRGTASQAERAKLTADPLKPELKALVAFGFSEAKQTAYIEARKNGSNKEQALASLMVS